MSKKAKKESTNTISYTAVNDFPKLKNYPTTWDMKGLYYKSVSDPQIEKDVEYTEKAYRDFAKKYRKSSFRTNAKVLLSALEDSNKLSKNSRIGKSTRYLALLTALNSGNEPANKKLQLFGHRLTLASNDLLFFNLELAKIPKQKQKEFLKDKSLADFHYDLKQLFVGAKHQLSEPEEKILRQLNSCSYDMWVEATEKMLGKRTFTYKGEVIPVNSAFDKLNSLPAKERSNFWNLTMKAIDPLKEVVENELTAVATRKKISDDLRGYPKPYSAAVISHEDDEKSVEALIDAVSTKGFELSQKFYKLKADIHKRSSITYAERAIPIGKSPVVPFEQATEICRDVFYGVNKKYGEIFDQLLTNGQIDVYPQAGKRHGAFCWGDIGQPTNVFLNQTDTVRSMETYAHEMGHAIHTERSKVQPPQYQGYSTTTAETASTLFEGILFNALFNQSAEAQKATLLHDKLIGDISTIQRQIAFHNFELEMHTTVREQGAITHTELNELMQKHLKSYLGKAVEVNKLDGNSYIYVSHFRYGFYVYTYTFGILMSSIMAENLEADSAYSSKIDTFFTAGGSDTVANIFKSIGINTKKIETFERGLHQMETEIKLLEKLTKKTK